MKFLKKIFSKVEQHSSAIPSNLSHARLQELVTEHKFTSACIAHLSSQFPSYARQHGNDTTACAISTLKSKKVELEAAIEVLQNFLNSTSSS